MATTNETETQGALGRQLPNDDTKSIGKPTIHSGKLIYAKPQDLPSFPSIGLSPKGSAASAAAALGWVSNTSPDLWKPDKSAPASAAAVMAKDYKLSPTWEPAPSQHSAKAALLASQSAMSATKPAKPTTPDQGHSAANLAFKSDRSVPGSAHGSPLEHRRSLLAAKGAMANRQRAKSSPIPKETYPDEANAAANALSAATHAHRPVRSPAISDVSEKAGSVLYTNMSRQMFTSRPPVKSEVEEQKRADVLHASAVAMAKKMYNQQQKMIDAKKAHDNANLAQEHHDALSSISDDAQPIQLTTLQDAAYKQAQARLAKLHEEHLKGREYQEYYGAKPVTRRFSIRGKLRKRASSDGDVIEDRRRSQQIRQQMSLFSSKISEVDDKKRQQDQEVLLAAAQRNVHERLKGMDEKISAETGMVHPSSPTQWEMKAHAIAQAKAEQRMSRGHGKVDIGAGKYMSQDDIDAIAAARVRPVLDEINEKVEEEQARQTELRLEMEKKKEEEEVEKARQKEIHDINKRLKEQDKQEQKERKAEEKHEAKVRKEEEKAAKAEQKRIAKTEKRRPTAERSGDSQEEPEPVSDTVVTNTAGQLASVHPPEPGYTNAEDGTVDRESGEGQSKGGVKTWFKNRFSRGAKHTDEKGKSVERGFIGGAALTGIESSASMDNRSASVRAVAMAGRGQTSSGPEDEVTGAVTPMSSVSDYDNDDNDDDTDENENGLSRDEARDRPKTALTPPKPFGSPVASQSPTRDSKFVEMV
ncbi:uncharacterized protein F4812DRAFT_369778 [Daldinia caldariorum]|uniref:uncharacterized protein n=1 Tax=Daldinia caldariorum TaxID=326644 RepID=UPI0020075419|nr:uncharacterized protein F4812DRAFT_369778 [Daldinia caldariorum]KAI1468459.1 hypothetical protein F4812DRAFT_369778 [Daldinia caldariorum]